MAKAAQPLLASYSGANLSSPATGLVYIPLPSGTITAIRIHLPANVTGNTIFTVYKQTGTGSFSSYQTITVTTGNNSASVTGLSDSIAIGDTIRVDVTTIPATVNAPIDVYVEYTQTIDADTADAIASTAITSLTEDTTPSAANDFLVTYDASATSLKKVKIQNLPISFSAASTTEVLTGTDTAKGVTADALAALWEQGTDIASSSTISVGEGGYFFVTGTTTITDIDFATDKAGRKVWVKFAGALTLTHNSTTLILPTGANITTAAGDTACFISEGTDNVRCVAYHRADGTALAGAGSATFSDSSFRVQDNGDATKQIAFEASGITTGTTRTLTVPNASGTIALTSDLSSYQPLDSDLTTIAGLTATTDNFLQAKSSAWASRTVAQVSADLQGTGLITDAVGFRTVPLNSQSAAYTTVAADSGKCIIHPSSDNNARTFTIDSNANVAYPVGTTITFINMINTVTISITSDTLTLLGAGSTGSRTLAANGIATAIKISSTAWVITGTNLT